MERNIKLSISGVELRGYNYVLKKIEKEIRNKQLCYKFINASKYIFKNWYYNELEEARSFDLWKHPKSINNQKLLDKYIFNIDRKYIEYSDKAWEYRHITDFDHIIYQLKCKLKKYNGMSYFGYTSDFDRRQEERIIEALAPRGMPNHYKNVVKLHKVIREAFKQDKNLANARFLDIYNELMIIKGTPLYYAKINYMINEILKKNFMIKKVELTKGKEIAKAREKWYTNHYKNVGGVVDGTYGTIKNGLNEIPGGGGGNYIYLPTLDIFAMLSLGLTYKKITKILNKNYKCFGDVKKINKEIIYFRVLKLCESRHNAYIKFLLPVIEKLLEDDSELKIKDICQLIGWSYDKFRYHFGRFSLLKSMIQSRNLDLTKIERIARLRNQQRTEIQSVKGRLRENDRCIPISQWKIWLIEGTYLKNIAELLGVSESTIKRTYQELSYSLIGIRGLNAAKIRKILRRKFIIRALGNYNEPKEIMELIFKQNPEDIFFVKRFYERLFTNFQGNKTMTYEQIIDAYYGKSKQNITYNDLNF